MLTGCATKQPKERKPDILLHEEKCSIFHHQVWETPEGKRYIKDLYTGMVKYWD